MTDQEKNQFETTDLCLAATLYLNFQLEQVDKVDPRKTIFIFKRTNLLDQFIDLFWKNKVDVNPRSYFEAIKSLKYLIYQK